MSAEGYLRVLWRVAVGRARDSFFQAVTRNVGKVGLAVTGFFGGGYCGYTTTEPSSEKKTVAQNGIISFFGPLVPNIDSERVRQR